MNSSHSYDPDPDPSLAPPRSARTWRGRFLRWGLGALVLVGMVLGVAVYLLRTDPDHWARHQAFLQNHSPQEIEAMAARVEARLDRLILGSDGSNRPDGAEARNEEDDAEAPKSAGRTESSEPRPDEPRPLLGEVTTPEQDKHESAGRDRRLLLDRKNVSLATDERVLKALSIRPDEIRINTTTEVFVTEAEMRALVTARLEDWMSDRGYVMPTSIQDPMATVDDEGLLLAFEVVTPYVNQVFSARFHVRLYPDGMALLELRELWAGRLPLPVDGLGSFLKSQASQSKNIATLAQWLDKLHGHEFKPVLEMKYRRRARIEHLEVLAEGVRARVRVQDHLTYKQTNHALATVSETMED